jgi:adenylate kinase
MINIVIFGAPGAGKGTQAKLLAEKYDFLHISTGDLLRQEVELQTPMGQRAQAIMNRGDLVGDDIVVSLLGRALELRSTLPDPDAALDPWDVERHGRPHRPEGCIIDGFPRTVSQAKTLEFLFGRLKRKIDCVVAIDVPRDELVRRIHERAAISGRADDTEEVIRHRLDLYDQQTMPVLDYYRVSGLLVTVDGRGEISETNSRICQTLELVMHLKAKR